MSPWNVIKQKINNQDPVWTKEEEFKACSKTKHPNENSSNIKYHLAPQLD